MRAERPPRVILTSNRTREVHDALKRRCLHHWIDYPDAAREYEIVLARVPDTPERLATAIVAFVQRLRGGTADQGAGRRRDNRLGGGAPCARGGTPDRPSSSMTRSASSSSTRRTCARSGARRPGPSSRRPWSEGWGGLGVSREGAVPRSGEAGSLPPPSGDPGSAPTRSDVPGVSGGAFLERHPLHPRAPRRGATTWAPRSTTRGPGLIDIGEREQVRAQGWPLRAPSRRGAHL